MFNFWTGYTCKTWFGTGYAFNKPPRGLLTTTCTKPGYSLNISYIYNSTKVIENNWNISSNFILMSGTKKSDKTGFGVILTDNYSIRVNPLILTDNYSIRVSPLILTDNYSIRVHWYWQIITVSESIHWYWQIITESESIHWYWQIITVLGSIHWYWQIITVSESVHWYWQIITESESIDTDR